MSDVKYNGWTNYETWCVNLWMDNDEGSQSHWSEVAQECWDEAEARHVWTREAVAAVALADRLKDEHEEARPDLGASVWADMLGAAFDEVNWHEIAKGYIEESVNKDDDGASGQDRESYSDDQDREGYTA